MSNGYTMNPQKWTQEFEGTHTHRPGEMPSDFHNYGTAGASVPSAESSLDNVNPANECGK